MITHRMRAVLGAVATAAALAGPAIAADTPVEAKQTKAGLYVTAVEAADLLEDPSVVLIDVRSRAEVAFLGLPERTNKHIPYMVMPMSPDFDAEKGTYELELNPDFPMEFKAYAAEAGIGEETKIILMCRSGTRSAKAASLLFDMGYKNVYSVVDGYEGDTAKEGPGKGHRVVNGWKNAGLAWSYKISAEQAYPDDL